MGAQDIAKLFKAIADDNRVDIVRIIARRPGITANELLKRLDIAQSTLSHHMRVLKESSLVTVVRDGRWSHYSINLETVDRLDRFINALRSDRSQKARRIRVLSDLKKEVQDPGLADALDALLGMCRTS